MRLLYFSLLIALFPPLAAAQESKETHATDLPYKLESVASPADIKRIESVFASLQGEYKARVVGTGEKDDKGLQRFYICVDPRIPEQTIQTRIMRYGAGPLQVLCDSNTTRTYSSSASENSETKGGSGGRGGSRSSTGQSVAAACNPLSGKDIIAEKVEFNRDVLPIIRRNCVRCHNPETGVGNARGIPLEDQATFHALAPWIVEDVKSGRMPQGGVRKPSPECGGTERFEGHHLLTADEIKTLEAANEAISKSKDTTLQAGDKRCEPCRPFLSAGEKKADFKRFNYLFSQYPGGFTIPPKAKGSTGDFFPNFPITNRNLAGSKAWSLPEADPRKVRRPQPSSIASNPRGNILGSNPCYLTEAEIFPGLTKTTQEHPFPPVHHAHLLVRRKGCDTVYDDEKAANGEPWNNRNIACATIIGSWFPGAEPIKMPESTAYLLQPGDQLFVQMHYTQYDNGPKDETLVGVKCADKNKIKNIKYVVNPMVVEKFAAGKAGEPEKYLHGEADLNTHEHVKADCIPQTSANSEETYNVELELNVRRELRKIGQEKACDSPDGVIMVGNVPHGHQLMTDFKMWTTPADKNTGKSKCRSGDGISTCEGGPNSCIIEGKWDFSHQLAFTETKPQKVSCDTNLHLRCGYKNQKGNPISKATGQQCVPFGPDADKEMCRATFNLATPTSFQQQ